jgi:hypothetical protein
MAFAAPGGAAIIAGAPVLALLEAGCIGTINLGGMGDCRDNKSRRKRCNTKTRGRISPRIMSELPDHHISR